MIIAIIIFAATFSFGDAKATADRHGHKPPCARMSTTTLSNTTLPYCQQFRTGPVAIVLPSDNSTVMFGALFGVPGSRAFVDRTGDRTPFSEDLIPAFLKNASTVSLSQLVFKATLQSDIIVRLETVLMIDQVRHK